MKLTRSELKEIIREEVKGTLNEENPDRDLFRSLNHINNDLFRVMNKYQGKADLDAGFRSWMMGLHAKLKKAGVDLGRIK